MPGLTLQSYGWGATRWQDGPRPEPWDKNQSKKLEGVGAPKLGRSGGQQNVRHGGKKEKSGDGGKGGRSDSTEGQGPRGCGQKGNRPKMGPSFCRGGVGRGCECQGGGVKGVARKPFHLQIALSLACTGRPSFTLIWFKVASDISTPYRLKGGKKKTSTWLHRLKE